MPIDPSDRGEKYPTIWIEIRKKEYINRLVFNAQAFFFLNQPTHLVASIHKTEPTLLIRGARQAEFLSRPFAEKRFLYGAALIENLLNMGFTEDWKYRGTKSRLGLIFSPDDRGARTVRPRRSGG